MGARFDKRRRALESDPNAVAEYWTLLPPRAELEAKLGAIVRDTQERVARRGLPAALDLDDA